MCRDQGERIRWLAGYSAWPMKLYLADDTLSPPASGAKGIEGIRLDPVSPMTILARLPDAPREVRRDQMPPWRNGRRRGLKIRCRATCVPVRVRPVALVIRSSCLPIRPAGGVFWLRRPARSSLCRQYFQDFLTVNGWVLFAFRLFPLITRNIPDIEGLGTALANEISFGGRESSCSQPSRSPDSPVARS